MSQTSTVPVATAGNGTPPSGRGRTRRLPRWIPWACFVGAAVLVGLLWPVFDLNTALFVVYTVVLGTLALYVLTRTVEGSRRATDRDRKSVV